MAKHYPPPRILEIPLSTFVYSLECSSDHAIVTIREHRARCAYGHRWVQVDGAWRSVGREG